MTTLRWNCDKAQACYEAGYSDAMFDGIRTELGAGHCFECATAYEEGIRDGLALAIDGEMKQKIETAIVEAPAPAEPAGEISDTEWVKRIHDRFTDLSAGTYAPVPEKLVRYVVSEIDKYLGRPGRLEFLRWAFDRKEIATSAVGIPGGLSNSEAEALLVFGKPSKGDYPGAKWELLNPKFRIQLRLWLKEVQGQQELGL